MSPWLCPELRPRAAGGQEKHAPRDGSRARSHAPEVAPPAVAVAVTWVPGLEEEPDQVLGQLLYTVECVDFQAWFKT